MAKDLVKTFVFLSVLALLFPGPALAYIDPGVGSLILQGLAAAAISALVFWRNLRIKIKDFLAGRKPGAESSEEPAETDPDQRP